VSAGPCLAHARRIERGGGSGGRRLKIERLLKEYNLEGLGAELEHRYTAEGESRASLRDLADYLNREVLRAALEETEADLMPGEAANYYWLLIGNDVTSGQWTEVRARLERAGIDIDDPESDFVTYQAVRSYLQRVGTSSTTTTRDRPASRTWRALGASGAGRWRSPRANSSNYARPAPSR